MGLGSARRAELEARAGCPRPRSSACLPSACTAPRRPNSSWRGTASDSLAPASFGIVSQCDTFSSAIDAFVYTVEATSKSGAV